MPAKQTTTAKAGLTDNGAALPVTGVVAAGGGNVVAAGGGNVAGGGSMAASGVAGGLNVTNSSQVVSAGSLNLNAPLSDNRAANPSIIGDSDVTVTGKVLVPGSLGNQPGKMLPVHRTFVGVYDLQGKLINQAMLTDDQGGYSLKGVPTGRLLCLRTTFQIGEQGYYLSALFKADRAPLEVNLDPVATVVEAKFLQRCQGTAPDDTFASAEALAALRSSSAELNGQVAVGAIAAAATLEARAQAYDDMAARNPGVFKAGVDALFDQDKP